MENKKLTTPVLLITFNRADNTRKVFEKIKEAKIPKLYIANDAPRFGNKNDKENRAKIREMLNEIDWNCELHTLFHEENQGCGYGPSSAISWAFENEDRLIILEDDCVPSLSFFCFCNEMLEKYYYDTRIWLISGRSHQSKSKYFDDQDYIFSHYAHTWGWATWKRCWSHFDIMMSDFPDYIKMGGAINVLSTKKEGVLLNKRHQRIFDKIDEEVTHSWDSQFGYSILKNGGLGIVPCKNLIKNIGVAGTHYDGQSNQFTDMESENMPKLIRHPKFVIINKGYEQLHYKNHIRKIFSHNPLYKRIINKSFRVLGIKRRIY